MTKQTVGVVMLAVASVLADACSTEVAERSGNQNVLDGDASGTGGAGGVAHGSGGARAGGGAGAGGSSDGGGGGTGNRDATTVTQKEASTTDTGRDAGMCLPPVVTRGGHAMYECSNDLAKPTSWDERSNTCGRAEQLGCLAPWGCGKFDVAREAVRACNGFGFGQYEGREVGFLVIGEFSGFVDRGYYDATTGEMIGHFRMDDVGYIVCAGLIPKETFGLTGRGLATNVVPLCAPDGGVLPDGGVIDAGNSG